MASTPTVGETAPELSLPAWTPQGRTTLSLADQRGQAVVLAFYPGDDTPVCTKQMCAYSDDLAMLTGLNARIWGISPQDLDSHQRFAAKRSLKLPLLADTDKAVAQRYGVTGPLGLKRSVFVVDAGGVLRWKHISAIGLRYQDSQTLAEVLRSLEPTA